MLLTGTEPMGLWVNDTTLMYLTIVALPETLLALQATLFDENGTTITSEAIIMQILAR